MPLKRAGETRSQVAGEDEADLKVSGEPLYGAHYDCRCLGGGRAEPVAFHEVFQEYDVEFVSSTEKFDTSTPIGRAMLNICIVFAQLERETIKKRETEAYYSRNKKGFF